MSNNSLFITVDEQKWESILPEFQALSERVLECAFDYISQNEESEILEQKKPVLINLSLSNNAEVHKLNREFRGMDKPTNVLSFANIDDEGFDVSLETESEIELGDIIIALETMQCEALEQNVPFEAHYCHLLTHGILHLLGYDHQTDEEADLMENLEIHILKMMNIENPYKE